MKSPFKRPVAKIAKGPMTTEESRRIRASIRDEVFREYREQNAKPKA